MIDKKKFILDLARHMAPLVSLYFLDGSIPRYLLLTAFNLSLGLMLIVGLTREASDPTTVDPRAATPQARLAAVVILSIFLAVVAAIITVPISSAALIMSMADDTDWGALFSPFLGRRWRSSRSSPACAGNWGLKPPPPSARKAPRRRPHRWWAISRRTASDQKPTTPRKSH